MARDEAEERPVSAGAVDRDTAVSLATELYRALAEGDRQRLDELLHPDFEGRTTAGLPLDLGGTYHGPDAMRRRFWGRVAENYVARAEPAEFGLLDDGRLVVTGRYTGTAISGNELDAEFVHVLSFAADMISGLTQITDSRRWADALTGDQREGGSRTVEYTVTDGVGHLRLNRPDARNAIDATVADELCEAARQCADDPGMRALLITGNGPAFTVGGDVSAFGQADTGELPSVLRRMIAPYHEALRTLANLDVPIVAAVHGSVAGGGLGLLYSADIALAAESTRFATGFAALGLSGDGGNSWFLPRLVGLRRAAELYFEQRVLDAHEAAEWGLLSRVVPADELETESTAIARKLAHGPTRAYGEIRKLLRDSYSATLPEQLTAETEAIARTAATDDARCAAESFLRQSTPTFQGR